MIQAGNIIKKSSICIFLCSAEMGPFVPNVPCGHVGKRVTKTRLIQDLAAVYLSSFEMCYAKRYENKGVLF